MSPPGANTRRWSDSIRSDGPDLGYWQWEVRLGHPCFVAQFRPSFRTRSLSSQPGGPARLRRTLRRARALSGLALLALAVGWLWHVVDVEVMREAVRAVLAAPVLMVAALVGYAAAFAVRAVVWRRLQPGLSAGHAWAALHVSLLGNHVLPLRLGEVLRVTSVVRRTDLPARPVIAGVVALRLSDLLALLWLAAVAAPVVLGRIVGWPAAFVIGTVAGGAAAAAWWWCHRLAGAGAALRSPGALTGLAVVSAWVLESVVLLTVAHAVGLGLSLPQAIGVTAVTVLAQVVAITPGGVGTYEAAGTAAMVVLGHAAPEAFAVVVLTHAVKTAYSLGVGGLALVVPAPGYWGRWRLPREIPAPPPQQPVALHAPIVVFLPAHNEEAAVAQVVARIPPRIEGHPVRVLVIDDGSTDATAARARAAGAHVLTQHPNQGLGAAVRRGLRAAAEHHPAAGVYLDADGEYSPEDIAAVVGPVLRGRADYVVGSRFAGQIDTMLPHRRLGNVVLTRWLRWVSRRRDLTDGQSGFRAFSPAALAHAEVIHDYNYAQVLTLDLLGKGFRYAEAPIGYSFRTTGRSFVSLGRYLRAVVPAVQRELNTREPNSRALSTGELASGVPAATVARCDGAAS